MQVLPWQVPAWSGGFLLEAKARALWDSGYHWYCTAGAVPAGTASWEATVHISSKLGDIRWHHINSLKSATVEVFSTWKLANSTNQGCPSPRGTVVKYFYQHITVWLLNPIIDSQSSSYLISEHDDTIDQSLFRGSTVFTQLPESCFSICFAHSFSFLCSLNMKCPRISISDLCSSLPNSYLIPWWSPSVSCL